MALSLLPKTDTIISSHFLLITITPYLVLRFQLPELHTQRVSGNASISMPSGVPTERLGSYKPGTPSAGAHSHSLSLCLLVSRLSDQRFKGH